MTKNFIKHWRKARGMTLAVLGDLIDPPASPGTISAYESGTREISQDRLRRIADALDTTPGRLLDGPPEAFVPAEVVDIWTRIPIDQKSHALDILRTFKETKGTS